MVRASLVLLAFGLVLGAGFIGPLAAAVHLANGGAVSDAAFLFATNGGGVVCIALVFGGLALATHPELLARRLEEKEAACPLRAGGAGLYALRRAFDVLRMVAAGLLGAVLGYVSIQGHAGVVYAFAPTMAAGGLVGLTVGVILAVVQWCIDRRLARQAHDAGSGTG